MTDFDPGTKAGRLRQALLDLLAEHERDGTIPTNCQFLWYELEQRGVVDKTKRRGHPGVKRGMDQDLNEALTWLRKNGHVDWEDIEDETRETYMYPSFPSIRDGLIAEVPWIHLDPWDGDPPYMITESRSLAGALRAVAEEYRVPTAPTNGQTGGFLHNDVAPSLDDYQTVLYLGDADLAGRDIEGNTRRVLEEYQPLNWERLLITREQLDEVRTRPDGSTYTLWDQRIRKIDGRHKGRDCCRGNGLDGRGAGHDAVEAEALTQRTIVDILRTRLDELLEERGVSLEDVHVRARTERAAMRQLRRDTGTEEG